MEFVNYVSGTGLDNTCCVLARLIAKSSAPLASHCPRNEAVVARLWALAASRAAALQTLLHPRPQAQR